jgi:hypothetical protein
MLFAVKMVNEHPDKPIRVATKALSHKGYNYTSCLGVLVAKFIPNTQ